MPKIIKATKPTQADFKEALILAGIKTLSERLEAPILGNGGFKSGIAKGIIGFAVPYALKGEWGNRIATAHVIDATEDIVNGFVNLLGGGQMFGSQTDMVI